MISARLYGTYLGAYNLGLCNQMFCAAAAIALAARNNDEARFSFLEEHQGPYKDNIFRNLSWMDSAFAPNIIHHEKRSQYDEIPYKQCNMLLEGYFQSEKYFKDQADLIRDTFGMDAHWREFVINKYPFLTYYTVSIHVRRGDYLQLPDHHPVCDLSYYLEAMANFPDANRVIFSDDIEWCKSHFGTGDHYYYIHDKDYIDLWAMSLCDHNIIANSTFSWWGAWLNRNPKKEVIAPKRWFGKAFLDQDPNKDADLVPEDWKRL